ncbi:hypothetical protein AD950_00680, partial [Gluconobacter oxydans]|uniref:hypothetical protein n=1 Tax=Gluconobacter oxydans TaxID=442 RepID=UPI000794DD49
MTTFKATMQTVEAIRSLITRIKLIPENGELAIFLEGDLAAMLGFAVHNKKNAIHHADASVPEKFLVHGLDGCGGRI